MLKNKRFLVVIAGLPVLLLLFLMLSNKEPSGPGPGSTTPSPVYGRYVPYSEFMAIIDFKKAASVEGQVGSSIVTARVGAEKIHTIVPAGSSALDDARKSGIRVIISPMPTPSPWRPLLLLLLPTLILVGVIIYLHKKSAENQRSIMRSPVSKRQDMVDPKSNPYRLSDVAGCDEAKAEVAEVVTFLKNPEMYARVGARPPKGVLMVGSPGTGKTLLAKAIAGEAGVPFFERSGSDFVEMFVGVGAMRVRELFEIAKKNAPSIIFIDEIDAVGRQRSHGPGNGGSDEREQTLNALLVEMDGFASNANVVVIAATNRSDVLDAALLRPGRFDREVTVSLPDRQGREDILKVHGAKIPVSMDVSWADLAKGTVGFSGADLANLVNEAAMMAARAAARFVEPSHFSEAVDKIMMGAQRPSMKNERERVVVAYHEAGHAVVAHFQGDSEPVHKISITPRGRALGVTVQMPQEDRYNHSHNRLSADIAVLMGGRAAEQVALSEKTVGASNDFKRATALARRIVGTYGMDDVIGTVSVDGEYGDDWAARGMWSEETKRRVDERVAAIVSERYRHAVDLITCHRDVLDRVATALLEKETLDAADFEALVGVEKAQTVFTRPNVAPV